MLRRATSISEFRERSASFVSPEGMAYAAAFRPRPDDVIIATYPKAGTTWMQQIVHGLRTRGDMDFEEITEVTPWIALAYDLGWDLEADQKAEPRAFKSHARGDESPTDCRTIVVFRDPKDTVVSFYNFMDGWFLEPGTVSADEFAIHIIEGGNGGGDYWGHLKSWWARRDEPQTIFFTFEDMKVDHTCAVRRVADFIGFGDDDKAMAMAIRQSTFDFMKAHERKFDDHTLAAARNIAMGLPVNAGSTKVNTGRTGDHLSALSAEMRSRLDEVWRERITAELGFADYDAFRTQVAKEAATC